MNLVPTLISGVSHPLINSLYAKKVVNEYGELEQVLVAETSIDYSNVINRVPEEEERLWEVLSDLPEIGRKAEKKVGHFDSFEIRYASQQ